LSAPVPSPSPSANRHALEPTEATLIEAARALTARLDVPGVCTAVLDAVEQVFGATASWVLLDDDGGRTLRAQVWRGTAAAVYSNFSLPSDVGLMGLVYTKREMVFVPDVQVEDRWFDPGRIHASGLRSVFMLPLEFDQRALGVIGLDSPRFTTGELPRPSDVSRLQAFAAQAAIAVTNARRFEASERDRARLRALLNERRQLRGQVQLMRDEIRTVLGDTDIIGDSTALLDTMQQARLVAPGDTTVLVLGETGTGKEMVARFIHQHSARSSGPFVPVNCAALPEALVESELFGHERGAFTGAIASRPGKFELANRGTLFLDEVGDLPAEVQAKLLRVLQDGQVHRVGGTRATGVDVRVIAATNYDLDAAVAEKRFRSDLFFRLSVFPIQLPPLRSRREDVPALVRHYLKHFARQLKRPIAEIEDAAMVELVAYDWPGNVRELQNVIERGVILSPGLRLEARALTLSHAGSQERPLPEASGRSLADAERQAIIAALDATQWRISGPGGAAEQLAVRPTTLHAKMKKLGIRRPQTPPAT
jgi:formate hydrogenlyase transcriptional activator